MIALERRAQDVVLAWEQVCEALTGTSPKSISPLPAAFVRLEEVRGFITALLSVGAAIHALHEELQNHAKLRADLMNGTIKPGETLAVAK